MTTQEAERTEFICMAKANNGYFGDKTEGAIIRYKDVLLFVYAMGWHRALSLCVVDSKEGLWLLENHPSACNFTMNRHYINYNN